MSLRLRFPSLLPTAIAVVDIGTKIATEGAHRCQKLAKFWKHFDDKAEHDASGDGPRQNVNQHEHRPVVYVRALRDALKVLKPKGNPDPD
jgi:hypothetical protein